MFGILLYLFFNNNSSNSPSEYDSTKISSNVTFSEDSNNINNNINNDESQNNTDNIDNNDNNESRVPIETKLNSFSTPIVDDHKNRINNIKITCSKIDEKIIKANDSFSFNDIVGQPSSDEGYKEAHAFVDGEVVNAIGGGNCQVSTTIYNAVRKLDGIEVTEQHEHERNVGYIEHGKDATVAYDYLDLKFENNNDYDIKLKAYIEDDEVCVDVYKIE